MINDTFHEWSRGRRESNESLTLTDYIHLLNEVAKAAQNYDSDPDIVGYIQRLEHLGLLQEGMLSFSEVEWT